MKAIEVSNLKKHFGKTKAVDGISFEVEKGEIFVFLGPNGAGKTTTIRCLMNFIKPTSGEIKILSQDAQKQSVKIMDKVGYLPGNVQLYDGWTGQEHIDFVESIRGKSQNVRELCKKLDFNPKLKFKHLSTGNKQKLGLILALMSNPQILIMDEPTVGLDPLLQNTIYEILEDLEKSGTTIFMSSHNLAEVERLCRRVGIIKAGKLIALEDIEKLNAKKTHIITVIFENTFNKNDFISKEVAIERVLPDGLVLNSKGDINIVLQKLAKNQIKDLEITHATLEEVFLEFYRGGEK